MHETSPSQPVVLYCTYESCRQRDQHCVQGYQEQHQDWVEGQAVALVSHGTEILSSERKKNLKESRVKIL